MLGLSNIVVPFVACGDLNGFDSDKSYLMATAAVSTEEFLRRNLCWSQAMAGGDRVKWLKADRNEAKQHMERGTFQLPPSGTVYPAKTRFLPVKCLQN